MNTRSSFLVAAAWLAMLAGCGGGLVIGIGPDDDPPSVSLTAGSAAAAGPGGSVRLHAEASDDDFVVEVVFYRLENDGRSTPLCVDRVPSYDCSGPVPANAAPGSSVRFYARAYDSAGQARDSDIVTFTVA